MKRALGFFISLVALGFVAWYLYEGVIDFKGSIFVLRPGYFLLACVFAIISYLIRFKGWNALCVEKGHKIPYATSSEQLASSEIIRYIPGNIWGFAARIIKAKKLGLSYQDGAWLLIHESLVLLYIASLLIILGIFMMGIQSKEYLILVVLFIVVCFSILFLRPILDLIGSMIKKTLKQEFSLVPISLFSFLRVSPYYLLYWLFFGIGHVFLAISLLNNAQGKGIAIFTWSLISWAIGYFSLITPSGLGVRELTLTLGLKTTLTGTLASTFSIFSRLWYTTWELIIFIFFKFFIRIKRESENSK